MKTNQNTALAAVPSVDVGRWWAGFGALMDRIRPRFARFEPARHAAGLVAGLLAGLERKNCWTIAEHRGDVDPRGLQHLLSRAIWDADLVRDDVRDYVVGAFGDPSGVLIVDETGDVKKGTATVGVQRQYTGTAGRIENAQVAVYLTYAAPRGHALIDRALYVPARWIGDQGRRDRAGVPEDLTFATKPALALAMIDRALQAGVPASWVAGDEVYGNDTTLREALEQRRIGYVLGVSCTHRVTTAAGRFTAAELAATFPAASWQVRSAGPGAKGPRLYSWALVPITDQLPGSRWLLVRRNDSTHELAYYRCCTPIVGPLHELVRVAGWRWKIEESFQTAKGQAGLDEHQVRTWRSWHRWVTLSMLAMAFLAVTCAAEHDQQPAPPGLANLTLNELRHLFDALTAGKTATPEQTIKWSIWRRKHQHHAQICHYRRRSQGQNSEIRL